MSNKVFMKGSEAIAEAAVRAGCRFFAGYPITPQNEVPEYFSRRLPEVGGHFVQGESEVASINMVFGAGSSGIRAMTSSSSPGISLKSEGISVCNCASIPIVYCNMQRGGPGIGSIQPAQQDYLQSTRAPGNGGCRMMVFAPSTVQEAVDMTYAAFDYAHRDRNPVLLLCDGVIGTIMEPVVLPPMRSDEELAKFREELAPTSAIGHPLSEMVGISGGGPTGPILEAMNKKKAELYESWKKDVQVETIGLEDAEVVVTGYGSSARIAKYAVSLFRKEGAKVGFIRPKTVSPFPYETFENLDFNRVKTIVDVEMSIPAQMILDVQLAVKDRCPITTCLHSGGSLMTLEDVTAAIKTALEK